MEWRNSVTERTYMWLSRREHIVNVLEGSRLPGALRQYVFDAIYSRLMTWRWTWPRQCC